MADIKINDANGKEVLNFRNNTTDPIGIEANDNGAPIPICCGMGACRSCVAVVESGAEHIEKESGGIAQVPVEENEILTCLACVKESAPKDAKISICCQNL